MNILKKISACITVALAFSLMSACATTNNVDNSVWNNIRNDRAQALSKQLNAGFVPTGVNKSGQTALTYAYREDSMKVFDLLLNHPAIDVNEVNSYGENALMYAALAGDLPYVQALLKRGAKVNKLGWTPLHYAAVKGRTEVVKLLLQQGAYPNSPAPDGSSALFMAVSSTNVDTVKALLQKGADPNAVNQKGVSALDLAKQLNNKKIIKLLSEGK